MKKKQRFVITGASSGLGKELTEFLAKDPDSAVFSTSRRELSHNVEPSKWMHVSSIDLLTKNGAETLQSRVKRWAGDDHFHVVNCAGYFPKKYRTLCKTPFDEAKKVYDGNVLTVFHVAAALVPLMAERNGGHFLAFSSHAVPEAYPLIGAFASAKAAVESLIRSIANEYFEHGVVANALAIATLDTRHERELRPHAPSIENWLKPIQICNFILKMVEEPFGIMNGNTLHLYNYSKSYFKTSYFDRLGTHERT